MQLRRLVVVLQFCGTLVISTWLAKSWWYNLSIYVVIIAVIRLRRALYTSRSSETEEDAEEADEIEVEQEDVAHAVSGGLQSQILRRGSIEADAADNGNQGAMYANIPDASNSSSFSSSKQVATTSAVAEEVVKTTVLLSKSERQTAAAKLRSVMTANAPVDVSPQAFGRRSPLRQTTRRHSHHNNGQLIEKNQIQYKEEEMAEAEHAAKRAEIELLKLLEAEGAPRRNSSKPGASSSSKKSQEKGKKGGERATVVAPQTLSCAEECSELLAVSNSDQLTHLPSPARVRQQKQSAKEARKPAPGSEKLAPNARKEIVPPPVFVEPPHGAEEESAALGPKSVPSASKTETLRRRRGPHLPVAPVVSKKADSKKVDDLADVLLAVAKSNALNTRRISSESADTTTTRASSSSPRDARVASAHVAPDNKIVDVGGTSTGTLFSHGALEWLDEGVMCKQGELEDALDPWLLESIPAHINDENAGGVRNGSVYRERFEAATLQRSADQVDQTENGGSLLAEISAMFPNATIHLGPPTSASISSTQGVPTAGGSSVSLVSHLAPRSAARFVSPPRSGADFSSQPVETLVPNKAEAHDKHSLPHVGLDAVLAPAFAGAFARSSSVAAEQGLRRPSQTTAAEQLFAHSFVQRASLGPVPAQALTVAEIEASKQAAACMAELRQLPRNASLGPVPVQAPTVAEVEASRRAALRRAELRQQGDARLAEVEAARGPRNQELHCASADARLSEVRHYDPPQIPWDLPKPSFDLECSMLSNSTRCSSEELLEPPWIAGELDNVFCSGLPENSFLLAPAPVNLMAACGENLQDIAFACPNTWETTATQPMSTPTHMMTMSAPLPERWNFSVCTSGLQGFDGPPMTTSYPVTSHSTMGVSPPIEHWDNTAVDLMRHHDNCMPSENLLAPYSVVDTGSLEAGCPVSDAHCAQTIVVDSSHSASIEYQAAYQEMYQSFLAAKLEAAAPDSYED